MTDDYSRWPAEPLMGASAAWLAGFGPDSWAVELDRAGGDFDNDSDWVRWWRSIDEPDDTFLFAVMYIEDRAKRTHRVTRSKQKITISLGIPVEDALATDDYRSLFTDLLYDLWHRAAVKLEWPEPPDHKPRRAEAGWCA